MPEQHGRLLGETALFIPGCKLSIVKVREIWVLNVQEKLLNQTNTGCYTRIP